MSRRRSALDRLGVETVSRYPIDVRGLAIAHGPVCWLNCHEVEEDVLPPHLQLLVQLVYNGLVERGLLFRARNVQKNQLDEDAVLRSSDAQIVRVKEEVLRLVFSDGLETILGHPQALDHLVVHDVRDGSAVFRRLTFDEVNSCEWHDACSFFELDGNWTTKGWSPW